MEEAKRLEEEMKGKSTILWPDNCMQNVSEK
jgi:hypothetical protein